MDDLLTLFRDLTDAPGPSGFEAPVRQVMQRYLEPYGEIVTDRLGSIAARVVGQSDGPKILIAGHLDEIGFMVSRITDEGYLKFQPIGGWWDQVMLAQRVEVITRTERIPGVIGSKPPHVLSPDERTKMFEKKHMFIDIGAGSRDEVLAWGINPGDPIVPVCPFTIMRNPDLLLAKAWDNRFGCALVVEVLRRLSEQGHPNIVYGAATVQEEVGLRGATTLANIVQPDIAFALDTGIAGDTPGIGPDDVEGRLGGGPVALLYDGSMIPHVGLRNLVIDTARAEDIPLQFDRMAGGGTDAGKFHLAGAGAPSIVLGVAVRYIHTNAAIMHRGDFEQAAALLAAIVKRLDADTVRELGA